MGNVIVNKNTKSVKKEDIKSLFSTAVKEEKKLSDGELIIVHDIDDPKIAILTDDEVKFIGDGVTQPADESIEVVKLPGSDEKGLKVKLWKDNSDKPEEEKEKNGLRLINGGLYVPEVNVKDEQGNIIDIPSMKEDIADTKGTIDQIHDDVVDVRNGLVTTNNSLTLINEKISKGVVNSIEVSGANFISSANKGSETKPEIEISAKTVNINDAVEADPEKKTEKVDGLATALDVKRKIGSLSVNGKKLEENPVLSGDDIISGTDVPEEMKYGTISLDDPVSHSLIKLQDMVEKTTEVLSAGINDLNGKIAQMDVFEPAKSPFTGDENELSMKPGVLYNFSVDNPEYIIQIDEGDVNHEKAGFFKAFMTINVDGYTLSKIKRVNPDGMEMIYQKGYTADTVLENGKTYYLDVIAFKDKEAYLRLTEY